MLETARIFLSLAFTAWSLSTAIRIGELRRDRQQTFFHLAWAVFLAIAAFVMASQPEGLTP